MNNEAVTRDGLIRLLVTSIAAQEGKFADDQITGDRDYVLGLTVAVVRALSGRGMIGPGSAEIDNSENLPTELLDRISSEIDRQN